MGGCQWCLARSAGTVAILAQGTRRAVAVTQAFLHCPWFEPCLGRRRSQDDTGATLTSGHGHRRSWARGHCGTGRFVLYLAPPRCCCCCQVELRTNAGGRVCLHVVSAGCLLGVCWLSRLGRCVTHVCSLSPRFAKRPSARAPTHFFDGWPTCLRVPARRSMAPGHHRCEGPPPAPRHREPGHPRCEAPEAGGRAPPSMGMRLPADWQPPIRPDKSGQVRTKGHRGHAKINSFPKRPQLPRRVSFLLGRVMPPCAPHGDLTDEALWTVTCPACRVDGVPQPNRWSARTPLRK